MLGAKSVIAYIFRVFPTHYLADGASNALQRQGSLATNLLDVGVVLGSTVFFLLLSAWFLRRQAAVVATI